MNAKQAKVVEQLKTAILANNTYSVDNPAEVKKCEITENEFFVGLFIEVGRPNDENTMASIHCRETRHIFIGKRGGVSLASVANGLSYKSYEPKSIRGFWNVVHQLPF